MTKRRSKGDGGLIQRHDHPDCPPIGSGPPDPDTGKPTRADHSCKGRWVGTIDVVQDGQTQRKYLYGRTKGEAKGKLDAALKDKQAGALVAKSPTVGWWLGGDEPGEWLRQRRRPPKPLKPNTWNGYAEKIRNYIGPALGPKRLDQLKAADIEAMYNEMRARDLAESTVRQTHAILKKALSDAVRKGHLGRTPMDRVDPPGTETNKREQFTLEQAALALASAGDSARWWLALFYGMRQGECLGLDWQYVDWTRHALSVEETSQSDYGGGARIQGTPKSTASRRTLPMLPQIEVRLRLLWEDQGRPKSGPVFRNKRGTRLDPAADWKLWRAFLDSATVVPLAPLPYIALHAARNTAASLMEAAGIPDRVIAQILGHANVKQTHRYTDAELDRLRDALSLVEALVSPPRDTAAEERPALPPGESGSPDSAS